MRPSSTLIASLIAAAMLTAASGRVSAAPVGAVQGKALQDIAALRDEVKKAETALAPLYARRVTLEAEAARLAKDIDALKRQPAGVRRDLDLQALLGASKAKTDELERVQGQLRWREPGMAELRRRVVRAIDQLLEQDKTGLGEAARLELERFRTATIALLVSPATPLQIVRDRDANIGDPLDGPRELRNKADLLRDSGDKLRREARRIAGRIDNAERRRHLRERAGAVDEDPFSELSSSRRVTRAQTGTDKGATVSAAGKANGETADASPRDPAAGGLTGGAMTPPGAFTPATPTRSTDSTVLRNLVDPATLDELRRADSIDDVDRQTRALKKAQSELESLAAELDKRAKALEGRADELKNRK